VTEVTVRRLLIGDQIAERFAKAGLAQAHFSRETVVLVFQPQSSVESILDVLAQAGSEVLHMTSLPRAR
jgi:hypothetical protein